MPDDTTQINDESQNEVHDEQIQTDEQNLTTESSEPIEAEATPAQVVAEAEEEPIEDDDDGAYNPFDIGYQPPSIEMPTFDLSQLPVDADGNADVNALAQLINQNNSQVAAATQAALQQSNAYAVELEEKRREEHLWQKATEKYPELKDKEYAKEVQAYRFGMFANDITSGAADARIMTPAQAAKALSKRVSVAKAEGVKQGTENVRVQESAYIESSNGAASNAKSSSDQLINQMRSPNRADADAASQTYLKKLLFGD